MEADSQNAFILSTYRAFQLLNKKGLLGGKRPGEAVPPSGESAVWSLYRETRANEGQRRREYTESRRRRHGDAMPGSTA